MLTACFIDFKGCWNEHFPLVEFLYNNSIHLSIYMDPFEDLFGRRYRSSIGLFVVGESSCIVLNLIYKTLENVLIKRNR